MGQTFQETNLLSLILRPISQCLASEQSTGFQSALKCCSFPLLLRQNNNSLVTVHQQFQHIFRYQFSKYAIRKAP